MPLVTGFDDYCRGHYSENNSQSWFIYHGSSKRQIYASEQME